MEVVDEGNGIHNERAHDSSSAGGERNIAPRKSIRIVENKQLVPPRTTREFPPLPGAGSWTTVVGKNKKRRVVSQEATPSPGVVNRIGGDASRRFVAPLPPPPPSSCFLRAWMGE